MEIRTIELLLVEDSEPDIELTLHALHSRNLANRVTIARDGAEALELIADGKRNHLSNGTPLPKLVLLDLKLPRVDGLEVLRQLKSNPETASIPIVVLTSSSVDADIQGAYALGVNSYIIKPVNFVKFSDAVCQLGMYWLLLNEAPVSR